ncbi:dephospho-CoA kinase [Halomonas sp. PAMB 3264]|uniref:dephospho-CoA kinase n=1 Tax=Halomonas sp. PAMB 3264 TaxID=3075222 RepID=UPI0028985397|nr:dephospho-CoA kinase [Halomonas sp. PAMB 3264]WNL43896.1 dephospho-CoA kinase [Halomonas sp. PAMB 3264]
MIIGLTGGIGSGKSTVAKAFEALGIGYVDADDVAREIVEPDEPALSEIADHFGRHLLKTDGSLDRAALRERIFNEPSERAWLESVTHPRIRQRIVERLQVLKRHSPYVLLVSPLLFESGQAALVARTLVVDVSMDTQRERTLRRDGVSAAQIEAILAAQLSREERLVRADDVLDNDGAPERLKAQVAALDQRYRHMSETNSPQEPKRS